MGQNYTPLASEALFRDFEPPTLTDPRNYQSADPKRIDAKYFGAPILREISNLIGLADDALLRRVVNRSGAALGPLTAVAIAGWDSDEETWLIAPADVDEDLPAVGFPVAEIDDDAVGELALHARGLVADTSLLEVGDPLYLVSNGTGLGGGNIGSSPGLFAQRLGVVQSVGEAGSVALSLGAPQGGGGGGVGYSPTWVDAADTEGAIPEGFSHGSTIHSAINVNLPECSGVTSGRWLRVVNTGEESISVYAAGVDTIVRGGAVYDAFSPMTLDAGRAVELVCSGGVAWYVSESASGDVYAAEDNMFSGRNEFRVNLGLGGGFRIANADGSLVHMEYDSPGLSFMDAYGATRLNIGQSIFPQFSWAAEFLGSESPTGNVVAGNAAIWTPDGETMKYFDGTNAVDRTFAALELEQVFTQNLQTEQRLLLYEQNAESEYDPPASYAALWNKADAPVWTTTGGVTRHMPLFDGYGNVAGTNGIYVQDYSEIPATPGSGYAMFSDGSATKYRRADGEVYTAIVVDPAGLVDIPMDLYAGGVASVSSLLARNDSTLRMASSDGFARVQMSDGATDVLLFSESAAVATMALWGAAGTGQWEPIADLDMMVGGADEYDIVDKFNDAVVVFNAGAAKINELLADLRSRGDMAVAA